MSIVLQTYKKTSLNLSPFLLHSQVYDRDISTNNLGEEKKNSEKVIFHEVGTGSKGRTVKENKSINID